MVSLIRLLQNPDCMSHIENDSFFDTIPRKQRYKLDKTISCGTFGANNSNNDYTEETVETESIEELEKLSLHL